MNKKFIDKIKRLPQKSGVYLFKDKTGQILYIGKAINLKKRVRSHFNKQASSLNKFLNKTAGFDWIETDNESQALILENDLIKKYRPYYNIQWRDDKSYLRVVFSNDEWPRVHTAHRFKKEQNNKIQVLGPFTNGRELKQLLRNLRKIFPYRTCKNSYEKACLQWHLNLCPAHKTVSETASQARRKKNAYLESLNALAQILRLYAGEPIRIEAYDISNIQGTHATGSMVVFAGDRPDKSQYRRFKIKTVPGANDVAMIKEVLSRRLKHPEWPLPDLILIDGGLAQLEAARTAARALARTRETFQKKPAIISLAKQQEEVFSPFSKKTLKLNELPLELKLNFQAVRDEAHRFAIRYYRYLHRKKINRKTIPAE